MKLNRLELSVHDEGPGMPLEAAARISSAMNAVITDQSRAGSGALGGVNASRTSMAEM